MRPAPQTVARGPRGEQAARAAYPESHAYVVVKESSGLIFIVHHRVRGRRRRKGRGTPAGARVTATSRRGDGRCGTMRWGSHGYKIGINERNRLSSGAFSISIMNLGAHRPATDESNETLAACEVHDRRGDIAPLASRAVLREVSR